MTRLISLLGVLLLAANLTARVPGKDLPAKTQWLAQQGWTWFVRQINLDKVLKEIETQAEQLKKTVAPASSSGSGKTAPTKPKPLPYKEGDPVPEHEQRILELINAEREKAGLKRLTTDPFLTEVARDKARDMIERHYFGHSSPEAEYIDSWMQKRGYVFDMAGENLSIARKAPEEHHQAFMNSTGHRSIMLHPNYTHVGVGVVRGVPHANFSEHPDLTTCVELFARKK